MEDTARRFNSLAGGETVEARAAEEAGATEKATAAEAAEAARAETTEAEAK